MKTDVVIPEGNETALISMALKLGYEGLVMVYPEKDLATIGIKPPHSITVIHGGLIDSKGYPKRAPKSHLTFVERGSRHDFEKLCPSVIFNLELSQKQDKTHYRLSGLDDVLCRLANKHDIIIGFSTTTLLNTGLPREVVLGRMMQNIRFCRRFGTKMLLASFAHEPYDMRSQHDLKALGVSLGMTPEEAKNAVNALSQYFN